MILIIVTEPRITGNAFNGFNAHHQRCNIVVILAISSKIH